MSAQKGPGRPAYEATEAARDKVKVLVAVGWEQPAIARALGISLATLKRHFRADLGSQSALRDRLEADRLAALYALAKAGQIGAIRELGRVLGTAPDPALPPAPTPGKTEQRQIAAERIARPSGGRFATPAAPRLGKRAAAEAAARTAGLGTDWGTDLLVTDLLPGDLGD